MSSTMLMERTGMAMPGMGLPMGVPGVTMPGVSVGSSLPVPRCSIKVEKCQGGMKLVCECDDQLACATLQNLCSMLAGSLCQCCCVMNGMVVCNCNLTMGLCKVETTPKGVCVTCTSGDKACCDMIQACCECVAGCVKSGCCCYVLMGGTPVCCGSCEPTPTKTK